MHQDISATKANANTKVYALYIYPNTYLRADIPHMDQCDRSKSNTRAQHTHGIHMVEWCIRNGEYVYSWENDPYRPHTVDGLMKTEHNATRHTQRHTMRCRSHTVDSHTETEGQALLGARNALPSTYSGQSYGNGERHALCYRPHIADSHTNTKRHARGHATVRNAIPSTQWTVIRRTRTVRTERCAHCVHGVRETKAMPPLKR